MPGSLGSRKRDNSVELAAGIDFLPLAPRSATSRADRTASSRGAIEEDADVGFRVEQDHCIGADGDDRRDGHGHPGEYARAPDAAGAASSTSPPGAEGGAATAAAPPRRHRPDPSRSTSTWRRPMRNARRADRQGLPAMPHLRRRASQTRSAPICSASSDRRTSPRCPATQFSSALSKIKDKKWDAGQAERLALQAAAIRPAAPR